MSAIQIFKPGTVTSMEGASVSFSEQDLQGIAARYAPGLHEAPFTIGHPDHDAPAYGWVSGLSFAEGALCAHAAQMDDNFVELHRRGRFKKVSARFYTPASPNNPTPGQYYLRDVGFLGAMAPAVKGLRTASFNDAGAELVTCEVSFGDLPAYSGSTIARLFRGLRDWLIQEKGHEVADRVISDWEIESIRETAQRALDAPSDLRSYGDADLLSTSVAAAPVSSPPVNKESNPMTKTPEQLQAELDAANTQIATLTAADQARVAQARHAEHVSFADGLIASARWPSGAKDVLVATLDAIATPAEGGCVSFGDGEAAKPLHEVLRQQLQTMPELVSFGEVAKKRGGADKQLSDREIGDRAAAYRARMQQAGRSITLSAAVDAVNAGTDKE